MRFFIFGLFFASTVSMADDTRELVTLPAPARETLRQTMRDNLQALNAVLALIAEGKIRESGDMAETRLGITAMNRQRNLPAEARPWPFVPPAMHALGRDGHWAASEFAKAAKTGDRELALAQLGRLTASCAACHATYRIR